MLLQTIYNQKL